MNRQRDSLAVGADVVDHSDRGLVRMRHDTTLRERIADRTARISIIGQGYVGLPLAVTLAEAGYRVTGLDIDLDRVAALASGQSHVPDVSSQTLQTLLHSGRYSASSEPAVLTASDIVIICVPTPLRKSKDPDISYVVAGSEQAAARFRPGQLVILESTTYPGTTEELLKPLFQARGARVGEDLFLAFSPERIDPGNATFRVKDIPKVVGGVTSACTQLAAGLYRQIVPQVYEVSSPRVAELAKLYENVFRNVNIALANEFAIMCRYLGINSHEVIDAAATKPFGFMPFYPGPGIGGHCIPVDPLYLSWKMRLNGYEAKFISLADEINRAMPVHVLSLVAEALNDAGQPVKGSRILVMGVAYKRGIGDTRESPAHEIIAGLLRRGARVDYADPHVPTFAIDGSQLKAVEATPAALQEADCVVIVTDHREFDYGAVAGSARLIVDTRNIVPAAAVRVGRLVRM
jgi:UDP-N-acetyl-D-glucosamine dehydrogenase